MCTTATSNYHIKRKWLEYWVLVDYPGNNLRGRWTRHYFQ